MENSVLLDAKIETELTVELELAQKILSSSTGHKKLICEDEGMKEEVGELWVKEEGNRNLKIKGDLFDIVESLKEVGYN